MDKSIILEELAEIVRDILGKDSISLFMHTTASDIEGWDSLTHVKILYECELKWNIKLSFEELSCLNCVGDLVELIYKIEH